MRKTTKQIGWKGQTLTVVATPTSDRTADITVDGLLVGKVVRGYEGSFWTFYPADGTPQYSADMLRVVMRNEAIGYAEAIKFREEVEAYDGPLDISDAEAPCSDCGEMVNIEQTVGAGYGRPKCPKSTSRHFPGHRVHTDYVSARNRQQRVIDAVIASRKEA